MKYERYGLFREVAGSTSAGIPGSLTGMNATSSTTARTDLAGLGHAADAPAKYYPFSDGHYHVSPGISRLGRDFGNPAHDRNVFQIDSEFSRYRKAKIAARRESIARHVCQADLSDKVRTATVEFMLDRLPQEHPCYFHRSLHEGVIDLQCDLTGERLSMSSHGDLIASRGQAAPAYVDALDALVSQMQEDISVISVADGKHWVSYLHLCFPNHWAAAEKIGRHFAAIHEPVAEIEAINRRAESYVKMMVAAQEGMVRFAWGLATTDALNQHPDRQQAIASRSFDPQNPRAFVRIERQTIWGLPSVNAAIFTIRTYFLNCSELAYGKPEACDALVNAVGKMSPAAARYKGLDRWRDAWIDWMRSLSPSVANAG